MRHTFLSQPRTTPADKPTPALPRRHRLPRPLALVVALATSLLSTPALLAQSAQHDWLASWGSAQTAPYGTEVLPAGSLEGATVREVVHLSAGGSQVRLTLSNLFGTQPLVVAAVHAARRGADRQPGAIDPATDQPVTFSHQARAVVPMGASYLSDPINLPVQPLSDLVITLHIEHAPLTPTLHAGARATTFLAPGDHVSETTLPSPTTVTRWYFLSGVEVRPQPGAPAGAAIVTLGDSITDGHGATTDANDRWPDDLARRLVSNPQTRSLAVINTGIGGNRVLEDGIATNALARFDRDVLDRNGVAFLLVLEGINDIGVFARTADQPQVAHDDLVRHLEDALLQMTLRAHTHGIRIVSATLTPFAGNGYYHPGPQSEADRTRLNDWIRQSGVFDGVVDFDAALRDPSQPDHLLPRFDSGDHLHPNPVGYQRMADQIALSLFSARR